MDELILRVLAGKATRFEEERLKQWRAESAENEAKIGDLARVWTLTDPGHALDDDSRAVEGLAQSVMAEAENRRKDRVGGPKVSPNRRKPVFALRNLAPWGAYLAASLAALAFGLGSLGRSNPESNPPPSTLSIALTSKTLRLDDGSFVRLSPDSRLEAYLEEGQRTVRLVGRAFFAVAPDPDRPFVVRTEVGEVRVLGTRFEVANREDGLRAVVVEGKVELSTEGGRVEVPEGSVGFAREGAPPQAVQVEDVLALLDWPGGLLVFHDTPLQHVAMEVERHFGIPVRIGNLSPDNPRISASFEEGESFQEIVETLCSVTGSECRVSADSAIIGPRTGGGR